MPNSNEILDLLSETAADCPSGYSAALHFGFHAPRFLFQTYPAEWREEYTRDSLMVTDPALKWGIVNRGMIRWSTLPEAEENNPVMQRARTHGIRYGFVYSEAGTVFNGARADREFSDAEIARICARVDRLHQLTEDLDNLSDPLSRQLRARSIAVTHGR